MPASQILLRPAHEIAAAVASKEVSAREVAEAAISLIEAQNGALHAYTDVTADRAIIEANRVDQVIAAGGAPPLAGVPYAVKNLFDVEGVVTRAGSKINRDDPPAPVDATLVTKMREAGGVLLGSLNMGEYAYDFTGENAHDGASLNPHDRTRMSGGSSGGSGTAVASGMAAISLGSDTNGSIRVPSSFCGLYGLKPTYGRLSRAHTFPFVPSLDHLGPIARSPRDLALVFDALQGRDPADPAQIDRQSLRSTAEIGKGVEGLRIAVAGGYFQRQAKPEALAGVAHVAKALGVDREIELPEAHRARAAAYLITTSESSTVHLDRLQRRAADFDPDTRDRFLSGAMVPTAWYVQAQRFRAWFRAEMQKLFETVDVILAPATPFHALPSGTKTVELDGVTLPARANIGIFTQPVSFVGLPVVAVPVWLPGTHLPIGVQVIAPAWREDIALRVAETLHLAGATAAPVARMPVETR
ncbi:AtzE family amidohydrolase [Kaistia dalseonensis]|uniref:Aspartyl-tRNA(Asn)/glutamyl-tRNA(Gln) amidotransferase subunit A n=1 Tax=Kaistia dalseonensis TaxID=410840 RepID=A0ABU0HAL4_9HYPH|nr:AtzE family amidohydrolase [Kaistia dalseonensis]MCX5496295.1 AtzE family amidohydrolase [Kaistia dalseonensis]MDQ0438913.1 aspartyl-tRNA(Asn)/glutamyl-tRNA(Gln) amidotransferase subunit A [Kaistia dalseonensis]